MHRWHRGLWGVVERSWAPPPKNHFCPQSDKFGCILPHFITGRKHVSLGTWILQFNRDITNLTKTVQKFTVRPKGGGRSRRRSPLSPPPPSPNTPLVSDIDSTSTYLIVSFRKFLLTGMCSQLK